MLEQHSQTNSYMTTRLPMSSQPLLGYYVGELDYGPVSVTRFAYSSSEKNPLNHFWTHKLEVMPKL